MKSARVSPILEYVKTHWQRLEVKAQHAIARLWRPVKGVRIHKFVYLFVTGRLSRDPITVGYSLGLVFSCLGVSFNRNVDLCAFFWATSFPDSS
jgi:hypothetical protein